MRNAKIARKTKETDINLFLELDGEGKTSIDTGCGFLNHMLELFGAHAGFNLDVTCRGDLDVDAHHTTEDIGIALGQAFKKAIGDKAGIMRYGDITLPMDEALILAAVDISGRGYLNYKLTLKRAKVGDFDTELGKEFWLAFSREAGVTLHVAQLYGSNTHHILEASFKAVARALKKAVAIDPTSKGRVPSTKGSL